MKELKCVDVIGGECPFVATGETGDEVKEKLFAHGGEVHPDLTKDVPQDQMDAKLAEMGAKMDSVMTDV